MLKNPRILLIIALLFISVATLIQVIVGSDNRVQYGIATTVSHIALVIVGSTYAKGVLAKSKRPNP